MENIKEIISNNIIMLRKQKNLTQLELGEAIHYSDKAISRWEKGESLPDIETLQLLSETLDVPLTYLFEEHSKEVITQELTNKNCLHNFIHYYSLVSCHCNIFIL